MRIFLRILSTNNHSSMVFFNSIMARITRNPNEAAKSVTDNGKKTRTVPGFSKTDGINKMVTKPSTEVGTYKQELTMRKLLFMKSLLKVQAEQIQQATAAYNIESVPKLFAMYEINYNQLFFQDGDVKIYEAKSVNQPDFPLSCRVYSCQETDPVTSTYLKILRHLGRKHPYIVHTWDMFTDNKSVFIIQDYMSAGNFVSYSSNNPKIPEKQVAFWAKQLYRALDFLGDNGIAHRQVAPNHLVVQQAGREIWIRLCGFRHAIMYWDFVKGDINYQPCVSLEKQKDLGFNFQSPEVYGNPETEQFDPITADIWSYGANIYYMLSKQYPFNFAQPSDNLDEEIKHNIFSSDIPEQAKNFVYALCRANSIDRMPFDFIEKHQWLKGNTGLSKGAVANVGGKLMQKVKIKAVGNEEDGTAKTLVGMKVKAEED